VATAITANRPHLVFNLLEELAGEAVWDWVAVAYLETLHQRYTGCNPRGLLLCRDKALCKTLLRASGLPTPGFVVFPRGRHPSLPATLRFPVLVKPLDEQASRGIAQASLVHDPAGLRRRVRFLHESIGRPAIAEEYVAGREITVSVLGNRRPRAFPAWEMDLRGLPATAHRIATEKVKWDRAYQERHRVRCHRAHLAPSLAQKLERQSRKAFRALGLSGYVRFDFRLAPTGEPVLVDVNPNPQIADHEDFADSARAVGMSYRSLVAEIVRLGLATRPCE
jgi:D-alanine-D-alanine ligase